MLCASQQAGRDGGVSLAQKFLESSFRDELYYGADVGSECAVRVHSWRHRPHYLVSPLCLGASAQRGQQIEALACGKQLYSENVTEDIGQVPQPPRRTPAHRSLGFLSARGR